MEHKWSITGSQQMLTFGYIYHNDCFPVSGIAYVYFSMRGAIVTRYILLIPWITCHCCIAEFRSLENADAVFDVSGRNDVNVDAALSQDLQKKTTVYRGNTEHADATIALSVAPTV